MLSAVIRWKSSYSAVPTFVEQPTHQGFPHPSPLVLGTNLLKFQTGIQDRDRTGLRRSEPSSRTTLTGEQPDPWDLWPSIITYGVRLFHHLLLTVTNKHSGASRMIETIKKSSISRCFLVKQRSVVRGRIFLDLCSIVLSSSKRTNVITAQSIR